MHGTKPIRTYVYIDGFNLYYGLLRGQPAARWLDLEAFVRGFLPERYEIARIYYFTAKLKAYPSSIEKARRQGIYLKALSANPLVEIIEGVYRLHAVSLPLADDETRFVRVLRAEEKRTDVNIAAHLLKDAFNHQADSFVLVSGDSDLTTPVAFVRKVAQKPIAVYDPHPKQICRELKRYASYYRQLDMESVQGKRLPEQVLLPSGAMLFCPEHWH